MKYPNIGCGKVFDPTWINLDIYSFSPNVKSWDIRKGLLFVENFLDVCYSSHVLEHLTPREVQNFVAERFRTLKNGGVI